MFLSLLRHYIEGTLKSQQVPSDKSVPRMVGAEVQADCVCIVYLCVPVCVIEGGGASLTPA